MTLPTTLNVLDKHNGFTAITRSRGYERDSNGWKRVWQECDTCWRPSALLRKGTIGTLVETDEKSFYQRNNNVTKGIYKVPGYGYRIAVWFDNVTGERIA